MNQKKGQWGSNFGFLMAAIGSAVGLGNIWGISYKMGKAGGFAFLLIYLIIVVFVGYVIMVSELALGRSAGKGVVHAYRAIGKRYTWIGMMGALSPFLILAFYSVLGGYCLRYAAGNIGDLLGLPFGTGGAGAMGAEAASAASNDFFFRFVADQPSAIGYHLLFIGLTILIVVGGVSKGIESFSKVAMPALFIMLCITIVRSVTLPGAAEGLRFMFQPDFRAFQGTGWISVLAIAGGQAFFSLSLGMGIMVTYGSYLSKNENLERSALIIPIADTVVAIMAGLAVMPAVFALGMEPDSGPMLLFVTLQAVFSSMGTIGPLFGFLFYTLVFIAAITSSISILEAVVSPWMDWTEEKYGTERVSRKKATLIVGGGALLLGCIVAADGLGTTGIFQPLGFCWLDFFDLLSEGFMMPLGSMMTAVLLGWLIGPERVINEVEIGSEFRTKRFYIFCLRFVTPFVMLLVLIGQIDQFFHLGIF